MKMKLVLLLLSFVVSPLVQAGDVYGLHLFFDEKEFVDVLEIEYLGHGSISGSMHVPDDFDAPIQAGLVFEDKIVFEVLVPKNASRPEDLLFQYEGRFFDTSRKQFVGFVKLKGRPDFVAAFTAFKRN